jgi:hypothetical protein
VGFAADSGLLGQRGGGEISGPDKRQREKEEWMWRESGNKSKLQICLPDLAFVSSFHLLKWKRERNKRGNNQRTHCCRRRRRRHRRRRIKGPANEGSSFGPSQSHHTLYRPKLLALE